MRQRNFFNLQFHKISHEGINWRTSTCNNVVGQRMMNIKSFELNFYFQEGHYWINFKTGQGTSLISLSQHHLINNKRMTDPSRRQKPFGCSISGHFKLRVITFELLTPTSNWPLGDFSSNTILWTHFRGHWRYIFWFLSSRVRTQWGSIKSHRRRSSQNLNSLIIILNVIYGERQPLYTSFRNERVYLEMELSFSKQWKSLSVTLGHTKCNHLTFWI